jgi:hypothetical protein
MWPKVRHRDSTYVTQEGVLMFTTIMDTKTPEEAVSLFIKRLHPVVEKLEDLQAQGATTEEWEKYCVSAAGYTDVMKMKIVSLRDQIEDVGDYIGLLMWHSNDFAKLDVADTDKLAELRQQISQLMRSFISLAENGVK